MVEQIHTVKIRQKRRRLNRRAMSAICIALCAALIGVSVFCGVKTANQRSEITELRAQLQALSGKMSENEALMADLQAELDAAADEISANKAEMEKYRKLIKTLETTNAEQEAVINSLTSPLNGRDEKTAEPTEEKVAYLTFDDGPSEHTEEILKILTEKDAVATFFVINTKYIDKLDSIISQGSAVAMHSYTHQYDKIYASVDAYFEDLKKIQNVIYEKTGVTPKILRLPGGSSNTISKNYSKGVVTQIVERLNSEGYVYFDWSVDSTDALRNNVPAQTLVEKVKTGCKDKRVVNILMHDTNAKKTTVEALPQIIDFLKEDGYKIMTLSTNSTPVHHTVNN